MAATAPLPETITEAAKLIRTGQVSVTELTTAYLECAKQFEPMLNAVYHADRGTRAGNGRAPWTGNCGIGVGVGLCMAFPSSTKTTSIRRGY